MSIREEAHSIIDRLPQEELPTLLRLMHGLVQRAAPVTQEERQARLAALLGSMPRLPSVERFLQDKHEETDRQEARLCGDQA